MTDTVNVQNDARHWDFYPIVMPLTKDGNGPASAGEIDRLTWEVWDRYLQPHASYDNLPDAINDCLSRNALAAAPKAEPHLGFLVETDDGTEWVADDPRMSGAPEYYDNLRPFTLEEAKSELLAAWEAAQPEAPKVEQEPVAWRYRTAPHRQWHFTSSRMDAGYEAEDGSEVQPLYTHPTPARDELLEAVEALLDTADREGSRMRFGDVGEDDQWIDYMEVGKIELDRLQLLITKHKGPQS